MPKTKFSKSELLLIQRMLVKHKMFPIESIYVNRLDFNGWEHSYEIIFKGYEKNLIRFIKVSCTKPNIGCLRKQLEEYFK